jgi:Mrp family chromosome partitioning ATPase
MLTSHDAPAPPLSLSVPSANGDPAPSPPPQPAPLPPALARSVTISGLARALRRQWVLALSAGVAVGVVAGCLAYVLLPAPGFSARASIAITPRVPADSGCIRARAKSRAVLDAALGSPEVKGLSLLAGRPDPGEFLRDELTVDWDPGPDVLSVRMSGGRPKELAALTNAVAEAVVQDVNAAEAQARQSEVARLEQVRRDYDESLGARRKRLEKLAGGDPGQRTARLVLAATALGARRAELLRVEGERRTAAALLRAPARPVADAPKPAEAAVPFEDMAKGDPDLKPLVAELADLNGQVAQFNALYTDNPAKARQMIEERGLQARIDALRALGREQYEKKLKAQAAHGTPDGPRPQASGTAELKARIASCEATEESLAKEVRKLEGDIGRLEAEPAEADAVRREIAAYGEVSKDVATALAKARLELTAPPRAALLDEAAVSAAGGGRRVPLAALTGAGFFALALVGVGLLELRQRHLYTVRDVAQGLGLPVAGTQPLLPAALNPLDPAHVESEQAPWYGQPNDGADAVRAVVMQAAPPTQPRLVMVLGAVGGEGGSVLAVQLAAGLARAGRRALLVDANLRRPALHRAFGQAAGPGLSEVLRNEVAPPAAVRAAPPDRLWVLTAGAADVRALRALARDGGQAVLDRLKRDYDYMIIDSAPALACADALPLAARCDAVLLSALAGASAGPAVHAAWQRLSLLGARLLGVVVQGAPDDGAGRVRSA